MNADIKINAFHISHIAWLLKRAYIYSYCFRCKCRKTYFKTLIFETIWKRETFNLVAIKMKEFLIIAFFIVNQFNGSYAVGDGSFFELDEQHGMIFWFSLVFTHFLWSYCIIIISVLYLIKLNVLDFQIPLRNTVESYKSNFRQNLVGKLLAIIKG